MKLAGRGISADASGTLWMLSEGKSSTPGDVLAGLLTRQGELIDELIEVWQLFESGSLAKFDFEARLESVVNALELWPSV
ncbi:hypothetical protein [Kitasatospora sp. NPDC047058]|uniref:hypothetical protein n=1 Tax=Kitasatospora sp. NPDC047058 TaxID=3155620 RepID=UPI0033DF7795